MCADQIRRVSCIFGTHGSPAALKPRRNQRLRPLMEAAPACSVERSDSFLCGAMGSAVSTTAALEGSLTNAVSTILFTYGGILLYRSG